MSIIDSKSTPMKRILRSGPGTPCQTGPITSPATRWWRRWTRSASTARSSFPAFSMYRYDASYAVEVQRRAHPGRLAIVKPSTRTILASPMSSPNGEDSGRGRNPHHADEGGQARQPTIRPRPDRARGRSLRLTPQHPVLGQSDAAPH